LNIARSRVSLNRPSTRYRFEQFDILEKKLPSSDAVFCRDFLQHLPDRLVAKALMNFSTCNWLFATSHSNLINGDIDEVGMFRPLNLMAKPFSFPLPWFSIDDPPGSGRIIGAWPWGSVMRLRDFLDSTLEVP
jgi:hypothetical protein